MEEKCCKNCRRHDASHGFVSMVSVNIVQTLDVLMIVVNVGRV